ncbi:MAG: DUF2243 domain-containing protein [Sphingobacteriaceae bacterium]
MKKIAIVLSVLLLAGFDALSCTSCNPALQKAIFDSTFYPNLLMMLSAFLALAVIVILLSVLATRRERRKYKDSKITIVPFVSAATILGIGIGGFIDGIVFHQILQWHEMLSNKIPPVTLLNKSVNMFWDGIFHAFCLIIVISGVYLLVNLFERKDVIITKSAFTGGLLLGWGIFNMVEGIIDHHILMLHNVKEVSENVLVWNYSFLAFSVILIIAGNLLIRKGTPQHRYEERAA